jgi:hypothetical protein
MKENFMGVRIDVEVLAAKFPSSDSIENFTTTETVESKNISLLKSSSLFFSVKNVENSSTNTMKCRKERERERKFVLRELSVNQQQFTCNIFT